jgi:hypothetical protein
MFKCGTVFGARKVIEIVIDVTGIVGTHINMGILTSKYKIDYRIAQERLSHSVGKKVFAGDVGNVVGAGIGLGKLFVARDQQ